MIAGVGLSLISSQAWLLNFCVFLNLYGLELLMTLLSLTPSQHLGSCALKSASVLKKGISALSLGSNPQDHFPVMLAPGKEVESIAGYKSYSSA